ncbi:type II secretion system F family protein [Vibrio parahaemolyticus]|uniref:type II secretion system F family protein n=1 Tax=Vibrio parahaemolyticus TaxID=670 RepID=UPI00084A7C81|nr:type II secretion system F family protein [Vibrio parahaemolyticus]EGQ9158746.1 type II secretion system protein F [Vibrio parahaemolyticus]EGR1382922.1 type II secretion system protein F [Vibrio parahaemolyticus]EHH1105912.1 type II secretion system protein F [Vibrio parahaemolyticus]EHH1933718.1 type II secretion system protein F [Vibrio parahaemolyticus]EHH2489428.1 type II secretion system protein F [Vibrio parahaemolyticus]
MLWLSLILFAFVLLLVRDSKVKKVDQFFNVEEAAAENFNAINVKSLVRKQSWQKFKEFISPTLKVLGPRSSLYIALYITSSLITSWYIVVKLLLMTSSGLIVGLSLVFTIVGYRYLVTKRRRDFENTFPDSLNILMSAVTAGDSLMQAISYVGEVMDNSIGREFKLMGDRLKLGESPEVVLQRSCKNYPYPEFLFFTVTLRANIARGGQLKGVLARLIRVLVDARTLEKKKMAMTSEARISAKIVAAIPLIFMIILNYVNPGNVNFVLYDPSGRTVLFYVLGSELFGLFIVWLLVRGVRA